MTAACWCVSSVRGTSVEVAGAHVVDPAAFPGGGTFAAALRQARQAPASSRARPASSCGACRTARSPATRAVSPRLEPLVSAGFKIDRVVHPCNALAALARTTAAQDRRDRLAGGRSRRRRADRGAHRRVHVLRTPSTGTRPSARPAVRHICCIATRSSRFSAPQVRRAMAVRRGKGPTTSRRSSRAGRWPICDR